MSNGIPLVLGFKPGMPTPIDIYSVRADLTERDAIPTAVRYIGRPCFVVSESLSYRLIGGTANTDWQEESAFNPTITEPVLDEVIGYNGTEWVNRAMSNTSPGLGVPMFLTATASGVAGYDIMQTTPDGAAEVTESAVVHDNIVLIDPYISSSAIGRTTIDAGIWDFSLYGYVSAATGNTTMLARVYTRDTGGTETLLFEIESNNINSTTVAPVSFESVQTAFSCNATDYLVIKIYGKTTHNGDITVYLVHSGTTHYSHIHVPLVVAHNELPGLQGGLANEYNHLSNAQLTIATQSATASQAGYLLAVDWVTFNGKVSLSGVETLTNKRITDRVVSITSSATPTIDVNDTDIYKITALDTDITGFTFTGTPTENQSIEIWITGTATRTITVGSSIVASDIPVPTATNGTTPLIFAVQWDSTLSKYVMVGNTAPSAGITLTTTGSSGAATLVGATLNIPTYTLSGLGGISASSTDTLTNKAITLRVGSETSNATPSVNCQNYDVWKITALAVNITSFTMTGTPTDGQPFELIITGTAARTIALGSQFVSTTITIPTTTVGTTKIRIFFQYDLELTKWACVGVA